MSINSFASNIHSLLRRLWRLRRVINATQILVDHGFVPFILDDHAKLILSHFLLRRHLSGVFKGYNRSSLIILLSGRCVKDSAVIINFFVILCRYDGTRFSSSRLDLLLLLSPQNALTTVVIVVATTFGSILASGCVCMAFQEPSLEHEITQIFTRIIRRTWAMSRCWCCLLHFDVATIFVESCAASL